jgi:ribonuclease P protein component
VAAATIERLRDGRDIVAALRARPKRAGRLAVVHVRWHQDRSEVRVAVVASRKVGGAVRRNRAKRLLREAARRVAWQPGVDVVLVARRATAASDLEAVQTELDALAEGLGVSGSAA